MLIYIQLTILCSILHLSCYRVASLSNGAQIYDGNRCRKSIMNACKTTEVVSKPAVGLQRNLRQLESMLSSSDKKTILSIILTTSYLSIVLSVMSLPVCLSAIYADKEFYSASIKSTLLSKIVSAGTVSNMVGKFVLGPPTDYMGGEKVMHITLLLSAAFLYGCSVSSSIHIFGTFWILFSFVFSAAWGAIGKIVRENFTKKEWAVQLGFVYTGSRIGSIFSVLIFGDILRHANLMSASTGSGWRTVFRTSSTILAAVLASSIALIKLMNSGNTPGQDIKSESDPARALTTALDSSLVKKSTSLIQPSPVTFAEGKWNGGGRISDRSENVPQILSRLIKDESFWLILASKISFVSVRQFSTFLPFYLTTGYSMKPSSATFASASFAFGSLISSTLGTKLYQKLSSTSQRKLISACNFLGFILPGLLWAHHSSALFVKGFYLPQKIVLLVISLWGVFWALPFGPSGALVLTLAGVNHVALLVNLFDAIGLFFASILSYYTLEYGKVGNWGPVLLSLSLSAAVAFTSMSRVMSMQVERRAAP